MKILNKYKVSVWLVVLLFSIANLTFAQPPGGGGQGGGQSQGPTLPSDKEIKEMVSDLGEELSLSDEVEASVLKLYQSHFEEVEDKTSGNQRPEREEMEALKTSFEQDVKALLTTAQKQDYEDFLKTQNNQRKRR